MRAELIGHFEPCMTEIYLHIDARMADYIRTHPYVSKQASEQRVMCRRYIVTSFISGIMLTCDSSVAVVYWRKTLYGCPVNV